MNGRLLHVIAPIQVVRDSFKLARQPVPTLLSLENTVLKPTIASVLALSAALFVAGCNKQASPTATANAPATPASPAAAQPQSPTDHPMTRPSADVDLTGIAKAEGGKTVAEVFAAREQLAGKSVTVRGKVVKTNAGIMGSNWVHIRDGSGAEGANDLTVTTNDAVPKIGDTVLVTGQAALNKDFGMGYAYPVILEGAKVKVEASGAM
jgi:hypothetical protein